MADNGRFKAPATKAYVTVGAAYAAERTTADSPEVNMLHAGPTFRRYLVPQGNAEHEHALVRVSVLGVVTAYLALSSTRMTADVPQPLPLVLIGLSASLLIAVGILVAVARSHMKPSLPRRLVAAMVDIGTLTFASIVSPASSQSLIPVYFFIIFGHGFRYGSSALIVCQTLSVAAFLLVIACVPWWASQPTNTVSWMLAMILLPLYVLIPLRRLQVAAEGQRTGGVANDFLR